MSPTHYRILIDINFSPGGKEMGMPGEDVQMNLKLVKQMTLTPNQQFTVRSGGSTVGSGKVEALTLCLHLCSITFGCIC